MILSLETPTASRDVDGGSRVEHSSPELDTVDIRCHVKWPVIVGQEASSVVVIENGSAVVESAFTPQPPFDQITALGWICELDNGISDSQSLLWTEIHLIIEMLEFVQALDSTCIWSQSSLPSVLVELPGADTIIS